MLVLKSPITAIFQITFNCNNRCNYCLNIWTECKSKPVRKLTLEEKKEIINKLVNFGVLRIIFSGGEPTVDPDLRELIRYASKFKINIILQTNGRLVGDFIKDIKEHVDGVQVSLEGTKEIHNKITGTDSFEAVIKNIKMLLKNKIRVFTNITLTRENYSFLKEYLLLLKKIGINEANITRLYLSGRGKKNKDKFFIPPEIYAGIMKEVNKYQEELGLKINFQGPLPKCFREEYNLHLKRDPICLAGKTEITISPNGEIFPCPSWPTSMGNIFKDNLSDVWESENMCMLRNNNLLPKICKSCDKVESCNGGCLVSCLNNKKDNYMIK